MHTIQLDIAQTIGIAAVLLVIGEFIKNRVGVLSRYFIPGPIIGGLVFSLIALAGHQTGLFTFQFYDNMRAFLLLVFFTTIGFSASFELLKKGGVGVALFLAAAEQGRFFTFMLGQPHQIQHAPTLRRISSAGRLAIFNPKAMFSATVRCGKSA